MLKLWQFPTITLKPVIAVAILQLAMAGASTASAESAHEQIRAAVNQAVSQQVGDAEHISHRVGHLDPRLRLSTCDQALEVNDSMPIDLHRARINVKVECRGSSPWRIYVPLDVAQTSEAVILTRDMQRGERLSADDITLGQIDANQRRGQVFTDPDVVEGHVLTRAMRAGSVITDRMVDTNRVIRRGDRVQIKSGNAGVAVMVLGEAMGHGGIGDRITVKNSRSGQTVQAIVEDARSVRAIGRF